jgi:hypothetical protein
MVGRAAKSDPWNPSRTRACHVDLIPGLPGSVKKSAEKRRLDEALEERWEATFPGSDPVNVAQPTRRRPNHRVNGAIRRLLRRVSLQK